LKRPGVRRSRAGLSKRLSRIFRRAGSVLRIDARTGQFRKVRSIAKQRRISDLRCCAMGGVYQIAPCYLAFVRRCEAVPESGFGGDTATLRRSPQMPRDQTRADQHRRSES
jgi:hypothetical protein